MLDNRKAPLVSIVVPVYNEAATLPELARRISAVMRHPYELIIVDDGSQDDSVAVARQLPGNVKVVPLYVHCGKSAALQAGFQRARGRYVVTMDADLQDLPEEVPQLLAKLEQGFDLVSGWKMVRQDPPSKTIPSRFFNRMIRWSTGVGTHDINCGLKAYRLDLAQALRLPEGCHRLIPLLAYAQGWRVGEIPVRHAPRVHGRSKYGVSRFLAGLLDFWRAIAAFHGARLRGFPSLRRKAQEWLDARCQPSPAIGLHREQEQFAGGGRS